MYVELCERLIKFTGIWGRFNTRHDLVKLALLTRDPTGYWTNLGFQSKIQITKH